MWIFEDISCLSLNPIYLDYFLLFASSWINCNGLLVSSWILLFFSLPLLILILTLNYLGLYIVPFLSWVEHLISPNQFSLFDFALCSILLILDSSKVLIILHFFPLIPSQVLHPKLELKEYTSELPRYGVFGSSIFMKVPLVFYVSFNFSSSHWTCFTFLLFFSSSIFTENIESNKYCIF